jgi:hypothetical protein
MQGVLHLRKEEWVQPSTQSYTSLSTMLQGGIPAIKQTSKTFWERPYKVLRAIFDL